MASEGKSGPRDDYITWDEYFMSVAVLSGHRSKDPNRQVGACIINKDKRIVGIGYNGFPRGCGDEVFPWGKGDKGKSALSVDHSMLETKYPYVVHAEMNAISNCHTRSLEDGCTMYVVMFPCNECTKMIIQSGIKHIVYLSDRNHDQPSWIASRRMLEKAEVTYSPFAQTREGPITISLSPCLTPTPLPPKVPSQRIPFASPFAVGIVFGVLLHHFFGNKAEK
eukprot:TRINITY_DN9627_c1_g2_i1.p1 TRINITY_DN9627_c1_g2~~TRINITY_DN9627_c1_g2_i1.p1  ORF type:complete len:250 (+),score=49.19 TRINITY_DN9627_c1_g2_i1:83-751(+)